MPVLQIHCPRCQADFVDSRAEWKESDAAQCPKCGEQIAVRPVVSSTTTGPGGTHALHVEPLVPAPLDDG